MPRVLPAVGIAEPCPPLAVGPLLDAGHQRALRFVARVLLAGDADRSADFAIASSVSGGTGTGCPPTANQLPRHAMFSLRKLMSTSSGYPASTATRAASQSAAASGCPANFSRSATVTSCSPG